MKLSSKLIVTGASLLFFGISHAFGETLVDPSAEVGSVEPTDESRGLLRGGGAGTGASASPLFDETVSVRPFHPLLVPTRIKVNIISKSLF